MTLPFGFFSLLDKLREGRSRSAYLERLLEREYRRIEQERFLAAANAAYTPEVCEEALRVNEEFPVHEGLRVNVLWGGESYVVACDLIRPISRKVLRPLGELDGRTSQTVIETFLRLLAGND